MATRRKYYIPVHKNSSAYLRPKIISYSALRNPKVGQEAKQNAQTKLNELGGDRPHEELHKARGDQNKDPVRVSAGYKA